MGLNLTMNFASNLVVLWLPQQRRLIFKISPIAFYAAVKDRFSRIDRAYVTVFFISDTDDVHNLFCFFLSSFIFFFDSSSFLRKCLDGDSLKYISCQGAVVGSGRTGF